MPLTNPPFMRDPKKPPIYLRDLEPEEYEQWKRLRDRAEAHLRKPIGGPDVRTENCPISGA
jgi:hypothetical protein